MANQLLHVTSSALVAGRLRVAMARMVRRIKRETAGRESPSAISALAAINRLVAPTLGELAEAESISPPSATYQADALVARGLIRREPSAQDRRVVRLVLTPAGDRVLTRSRSERTAWFARQLRRLPAEDVRMLEAAAGILERLLEEEP